MNKRNYNVFFNTHTVSGIIISVGLYVIFFAGAFALFKDEIKIWEEGTPLSHIARKDINYDNIFDTLHQTYDLTGRDLQLNFGGKSDQIYVAMSASKDTLASQKQQESQYFSVDINTLETKTYNEHYSLGEFLYRLHFLGQIPYAGLFLAGIISLFFLFAIVTGVIVHWRKIIPNFYYFNPKIALKRVWADAHTALGLIGLPFQFVFAVSGAYFCLSILVLLPAGLLYNGDQSKLIADMRPDRKVYNWKGETDKPFISFNEIAEQAETTWDQYRLTRGFIKNYAGNNMKYILSGELSSDKRFIGVGSIIIDAYTGKVESEKNPNTLSYIEDAQFVFGRLHFAHFGGNALKLMYFLLALITCFVIISGVLIWIEARNKKSMTISQRLYTAKVGHVYLAICLSMLPVTALSFLFVKFAEGHFTNKISAIYWFYFTTWLLFILFFRFKRDNYFTNKYSLLLGGVIGLLIPISNGIVSGNWIWVAFLQQQFDILLIDFLWIGIAITSLIFYVNIKPEVKANSAFTKHPLNYKDISNAKAIGVAVTETQTDHTNELTTKNNLPMRTKVILLWFILAFTWIVHHIYGLFNIYYNETLIMDGATGAAPLEHHIFRIILEGFCLLFALLSIEVSKKWFKTTSFIWACLAGLYNVYHLISAFLYEPSNVSEIFMLLLTVIASIFLVRNTNQWRQEL
ncbi:MAG: PepSY domain-containing protein [Saprospiraceae bacterium]|nr:PepSY domain-containing protein [Saprospiraceae bacterium]